MVSSSISRRASWANGFALDLQESFVGELRMDYGTRSDNIFIVSKTSEISFLHT
jgi:hypothetical protein